MKPLTGLDATFVYLETPQMPMHVGSFNLCELPTGFKGSFYEAVTHHIAGRMHLAPVFSRKLAFMPLDLGHPVWVQADRVDIGFHVRRADLVAKAANQPSGQNAVPITLAQAHALCAKLHSEPIDRNFPLWEFYVFDHIELPASQGGKLVAGFFSKIHHAALDGKGAVMLANAILDTSPTPRAAWLPGPTQLSAAPRLKLSRMVGSVFSSSFGQMIKAMRAAPLAASALGGALARQPDTFASRSREKAPLLAPPTPFNTGATAGRVFATATLPLAQCKAIGKAAGASFNDVVLWICSTALRAYLSEHHSLPKKSLVAAMPVSLRETNSPASAPDAANLGNQVSMRLVQLATHVDDPVKRLDTIKAATACVKKSTLNLKSLLPTDYPSLLAPWLVGGVGKIAFDIYGKSAIASRLPVVANLVISNVPGSPVPLYLAGAQFLSFHPLSIIVHGLALNMTVQTYAGRVDFGIVADEKALLHPQDFIQAIEAAFVQARSLFVSPPPATAPTLASQAMPVVARTAAVAVAVTPTVIPVAPDSRRSTQKSAPKSVSEASPKASLVACPTIQQPTTRGSRPTQAALLNLPLHAKPSGHAHAAPLLHNPLFLNTSSHGQHTKETPQATTPAQPAQPAQRSAKRTAKHTDQPKTAP